MEMVQLEFTGLIWFDGVISAADLEIALQSQVELVVWIGVN